MRRSKILLMVILSTVSSSLIAASGSVPESCVKLVGALEACEAGSSGPFGSIRKACISTAKSEYKCDMPIDEVKKLIKK